MRDGSHRITCSKIYPCCWWQWFGTLSYAVPYWWKRVIGSGASATLSVCLCSQLQKQCDKLAHISNAVLPWPQWITSLPTSQNKPILEFFLLVILSQLYKKYVSLDICYNFAGDSLRGKHSRIKYAGLKPWLCHLIFVTSGGFNFSRSCSALMGHGITTPRRKVMPMAHRDAAKIMCRVPSKYWWVEVFPLRARFSRQKKGTETFIWIGERRKNKYRGLIVQGGKMPLTPLRPFPTWCLKGGTVGLPEMRPHYLLWSFRARCSAL